MNQRLNNLRIFIEQNGGGAKVANTLGYANAAFLSQMVGPKATRPITEKTLRKFEMAYGLEHGYFDRDLGPVALDGKQSLDLAKKFKDAGVEIPISKYLDVVAFVDKHSLGRKDTSAFVDDLVDLFKR